VSSKFRKRLSNLREQFDGEQSGMIGFFGACLAVLLFFYVLSFLLPHTSFDVSKSPDGTQLTRTKLSWIERTNKTVLERVGWLENSIIGQGAANGYFDFARWTVSTFVGLDAHTNVSISKEDFGMSSWFLSIKQTFVDSLLGVGFILIPFWPFWFAGGLFGVLGVRLALRTKSAQDALGICDRKTTPFYSGIYGPFRPNNSVSGTNLSCPSLASPQMEKKHLAIKHELVRVLIKFSALNETNLELVRIILAYRDYPSFVEEENPIDEESGLEAPASQQREHEPSKGYITHVDRTIEQSALDFLSALLEAHTAIIRYYRSVKSKNKNDSNEFDDYSKEQEDFKLISSRLSPLASTLLLALSPGRRKALETLPIAAVASAYLALEAGKCLVYKKVGSAYSQISRFPHLQARAVIHSILSYHTEYDGDMRLNIRQSIICSRRHGDFGRVFIPNRMSSASRGLRDWLEILSAPKSKQSLTAELTELDAHFYEIHANWREEYLSNLQQDADKKDKKPKKIRMGKNQLQNGIICKSVVLMPLKKLVDVALRGISKDRQDRITKLLQSTKEHRAKPSIAARLPGYQRQIIQIETTEAEMEASKDSTKVDVDQAVLNKRWNIVKQVLMQFNWLSTRVGNDTVPDNGLIKAVVTLQNESGDKEVIGLDSLVPLRQRRYRELFGNDWERRYFDSSAYEDDIELFIDEEDFNRYLKEALSNKDKKEEHRRVSV
jgi:hypothetical protein